MESRQAKPGYSKAEKACQSLNKAAFDKLKVFFNIVHALAKHNRPLADFTFQLTLHETNTQMSLGHTYRSPKEAVIFLNFIAATAFKELKDSISKSKFLSITGDDSTDISTTEQSMWFIRSSSLGVISTNFLGSVSLDKANAEGIVAGLEDITKSNINMPLSNLMAKVPSITTVGASVMLGRESGVCVRLQKLSPWLVILHCMAHKLELSYKETCKEIKLYETSVATLAFDLYKFYQKSPLNRANLRRAAVVAEQFQQPTTVLQQHLNVQGSRGNWVISKVTSWSCVKQITYNDLWHDQGKRPLCTWHFLYNASQLSHISTVISKIRLAPCQNLIWMNRHYDNQLYYSDCDIMADFDIPPSHNELSAHYGLVGFMKNAWANITDNVFL